jgi:glutamate dehydrogenase
VFGQQDNSALLGPLSRRLAADPPEDLDAAQRALLQRLLPLYYRDLGPADLDILGSADLVAALAAHWRLFYQRQPDEVLLRVYNPVHESHGWRCRDSVAELVCPDTPFLVDSVSAALNRRGLVIRLTLHPVLRVTRDGAGQVIDLADAAVAGPEQAGVVNEAVIRLHLERQPDDRLQDLADAIRSVVADVRMATGDWGRMRARARQDAAALEAPAAQDSDPETVETRAFLDWLADDHFLFVAAGHFVPEEGGGQPRLALEAGSGLGILRDGDGAERGAALLAGIDPRLDVYRGELLVTKCNARSTVHRPNYLDCIVLRRRDADGRVTGLSTYLGLFSSVAYQLPPRLIPVLRRKAERVAAAIGVTRGGYTARALEHIVDGFPRDTLFQVDHGDLLATTRGVLELQERQRTRLFLLREPFGRFFTGLVYLPRERYSREVRAAIQGILVEAVDAHDVEFETQFSESVLARIRFVLRTRPGTLPALDLADLESRVVEAATSWYDGLSAALFEQVDELLAARYLHDYGAAFPGGYREDCHPRVAVNDIGHIERALAGGTLAVHLYQPELEHGARLHVRLYAPGAAVSLSRAIPTLEHMGLRVHEERPYRIRHPGGPVWIHDFSAEHDLGGAPDEHVATLFVETFTRAWRGEIDDDGFNALVLRAGLSWRQAMLFRVCSRYLHQVKTPYTQSYICAALNANPGVVRVLLALFECGFDPARSERETAGVALRQEFETLLEAVQSLDQDRILRSFLNVFDNTLRTNFFQPGADGAPKPYLSLKIDSRGIAGAPQPRPAFEIFVCSAQMEGVHLRGGPVARGGIRASDRMQDYRSEILGLLRAQMVKNSLIVPVGAKGGFIARGGGGDGPGARRERMLAAYRTLLRGMLDLTDNLVAGRVVPPHGVVRRDGDDPYLVIAADKGTAGLSDLANEIAADYGFWLGDAFASGGSAGYDHKAMGITARGAWESVKRHFRELGRDTQNESFSVVGIGDMGGDVFGNGMLMSRGIRLLAAFNHEHIFLDPDPDPAVSFAERERLFRLPQSRWSDYDRSLISPGGGVYPRSAKSIAITPQVAAALAIEAPRLPPAELIQALLRAPVDLLWNGGIGTFVKASIELHAAADDKANDALRVDADSLRCKVVGEGGNLGFTQRARIEFAQAGGQIYTDAIDNSGGVDCSDREVNIKVLLDRSMAAGDLTLKQRNLLLADMTDDVAGLVLADNRAQTLAISVAVSRGAQRLHEQARFVEVMEQNGRIDRALEGLPDRKALTARLAAGQGLTKPELAVLLAYSRMNYFEAIVASDIADDPFVQDVLAAYFPPQLVERFADGIRDHRLRREIVATSIAVAIVNRVGPGVGFRIREEVGVGIADVARAYLVASRVFGTDAVWRQVEALAGRVPAALQTELFTVTAEFIERGMAAVLRAYKDCLVPSQLVERLRDGVHSLWEAMPRPLAGRHRSEFERRVRRFTRAGVPLDLARSLAAMPPMTAALDVVDVAQSARADVVAAAWIHSALSAHLELDWVRRQVEALAVQSHWHLQARAGLRADADRHLRDLTAEVLAQQIHERSPRGCLEHWLHDNHAAVERYRQRLAEFKAGGSFDYAILSLVVAGVGDLVRRRVEVD